MNAMSMKLIGTALLWAGLAALVYVPSSDADVPMAIVAGVGFLFFASGLLMFADGQKKAIATELRRGLAAVESAAQQGGG